MLNPYAIVIDQFLDDFSGIGFTKQQDLDFAIQFSNGTQILEISTEKSYHPSLSTCLIDQHGNRYALRLIREILEPHQFTQDLIELNAIKEKYNLVNLTTENILKSEGCTAYLSLAIKQLLAFISQHKTNLYSGAFKPAYAIKEQQALQRIGL